jgi:EmrB/QacA subfamily drug resistance transporter
LTDSQQITPRERNITLTAIMVVFLLSALDNTIVSTAMPRIISELQGLNLYTWVTTAYLLASTVMVPIYGKLSDMYGRKPILVFGVIIFLLGSMLSGMAGEFGALPLLGGGMTQLILFRAVQGLGGAALITSAFAVIADLIPARERGRYQGLFGGVFGLASVLGPIIGGFFTDMGTVTLFGYAISGWRWIFYVNIPLGLLALWLIVRQMPRLGGSQPGGRIDYAGAVLVLTTFIPLLLGLTWGGSQYAWNSPVILALLGGSLLSLALFLLVEARSPNPILPLELFRNPVFATANAAAFVLNVAFLGVVMFLPLFMQLVLGVSATNSGFTLLPLMGGLIGSSIISGLLVTKTGRYRIYMLAGSVILLLGLFLLTQISLQTTTFDLGWRMIIVGIGLGPIQSLFTLAIQNAVPRSQLGTATSASQFFRQIGSTIGLAVFGTLLTLHVSQDIPRHLPDIPALQGQTFDIGSLNQAQGSEAIKAELSASLDALFTRTRAALEGNEAARSELLASPETPAELRSLLESGSTVSAALVLPPLRAALEAQAVVLAGQLEEGVRLGFTESIRKLFLTAFWITLGGALLVVFVPERPLREAGDSEDGTGAGPVAPASAAETLPAS